MSANEMPKRVSYMRVWVLTFGATLSMGPEGHSQVSLYDKFPSIEAEDQEWRH